MASSLFHILQISRQDMLSRLLELDTSSSNLANVNTVGYKRQRTNFQELMEKAGQDGVTQVSTQVIATQGTLRETGRLLDVALQGDGFLQVRLPDGTTGYTRDGQLMVDSNLNLVTASGNRLVWQGTLPAATEEVQITERGEVRARVGTTWSTAGTIQLARFTNPSALLEKGENVYVPTKNSGAAQVGTPGTTLFGTMTPGALEQSNVDSAEEMTKMMLLQRDFQISVRAFQQTDTMIGQAIQMRRA